MNQWTLPKHHVILFIQYLSLFVGPDEQQVQANHHLPLGHPFESISGVHITRMWPIFNICPDLLALMNNRSRPTNYTPRTSPWINQCGVHITRMWPVFNICPVLLTWWATGPGQPPSTPRASPWSISGSHITSIWLLFDICPVLFVRGTAGPGRQIIYPLNQLLAHNDCRFGPINHITLEQLLESLGTCLPSTITRPLSKISTKTES